MQRANPTTRTTPSLRFVIVDLRKLRGHEQIRPQLLVELTEQIRADGFLKRPILVADRDLVILDGHHRAEAVRSLGCRRIAAYLVDYSSDVVILDTWPDAIIKVVSKEEVIRRGRNGEPFPPKTTRHSVTVPLEDRPTALEDLL